MKFEVKNRRTGDVQFTADIECDEDASYEVKLGLAVRWGSERGANLARTDLFRANLSGAYLANTDLSRANLANSDLRGAYLANSDLRGAYLANSDLRGADLTNADLTNADLARTNLARTNLTNANLRDADLRDADLDKENDLSLQGNNPLLMINPIGSESGTLIAYKTNKGIYLRRGCFFGTMETFLAAVQKKHGDSRHGSVYRAACQFIEAWAGD